MVRMFCCCYYLSAIEIIVQGSKSRRFNNHINCDEIIVQGSKSRRFNNHINCDEIYRVLLT